MQIIYNFNENHNFKAMTINKIYEQTKSAALFEI